jgi:hypothetical protein
MGARSVRNAPPEPERTRTLRIIAQDPGVKRRGRILTAEVSVPAELLAAGPWGHRVQIIDYDASSNTLYEPLPPRAHGSVKGKYADPYLTASDAQLLGDPNFHAQNVYAIAMRTLARFEFALGRRVSWGFGAHQLKIAPHAFAEANAYYSARDEAIVFGYFPARDGSTVFSCLSHDVVAHETTHALVDGLRTRFTDPSSPDQAAFHEGFADVIALLSVFSIHGIVEKLIDVDPARPDAKPREDRRLIDRKHVSLQALKKSMMFGLAAQMGSEISGVRGRALRNSLLLKVSPEHYLRDPEFLEPHRRGEILVAAVLNAFVHVWAARLKALGDITPGRLDRPRVVEEGAAAADYLLTMAVRALDYTPPVQLEFGDFLSALLTADAEIRPDDTRYQFRAHLRESFAAFGIEPASSETNPEKGIWSSMRGKRLTFSRTHFDSLMRDPDEVFSFIWENRTALGIHDGAYGHVLSVRPCLRVAPDGFSLRETVAEFYQVLKITAAELGQAGLRRPDGMPKGTLVSLYGGNALVFDEYGQLKFNVHNSFKDVARQQRRLDYLWKYGYFNPARPALSRFGDMHLRRGMAASIEPDNGESW